MKNRPDNTGENNPSHHTHTTPLQRKQRSPKCIEFYQLRYPDESPEEQERMRQDHLALVKSRLTPDKISTKIEYWLAKRYSPKEAQKKLS